MSDYWNVSHVYLETALCNTAAPSTALRPSWERTERLTARWLRNGDMEGTPRNVLVTPLHCQDIVPPFLDNISDVVLMAAQMLDGHLFTRYCRSVDAN